jgi:hypothetical protein
MQIKIGPCLLQKKKKRRRRRRRREIDHASQEDVAKELLKESSRKNVFCLLFSIIS